MRQRLLERAHAYDTPYDHTQWEEHRRRVAWTVRHGVALARMINACDLIDLSCGDAAIPLSIKRLVPTIQCLTLGTLVDRDDVDLDVIGPIEETLDLHVREGMKYDLLVCTETLEHLEDPDLVLRKARTVASHMLLTTPLVEPPDSKNWEHVWSWDRDGVNEMLTNAGWAGFRYDELVCDFYTYQLWSAL